MFIGDLDLQDLTKNHDFHYQKLSNKLSGFHSRIQLSVGPIFLIFGYHFHSNGPWDILLAPLVALMIAVTLMN